jgi:uncharacterized protein YlzI (FlbEa/FlbD family)
MPMLKFTLLDGAPIWIGADKVAAVQRDQFREGSGVTHTLGAIIIDNVNSSWVVQESAEDVVDKIEQAGKG